MSRLLLPVIALVLSCAPAAWPQVAVRGKKVHTMAGPAIEDGMVLLRDGKIAAVGKASDIKVPEGFKILEAAVVTPGIIDARSVVGLAGSFNYNHDQDQLETSSPIQPELRALDAFNPREKLIEWVRGFGVTAIHTGHGPGELISGQTMVVKTRSESLEKSLVKPFVMLAVTLSTAARKEDAKSPGTRGKMVAMLRAKLIQAGEYSKKLEAKEEDKRPARDLSLEALLPVLRREIPLLVTAHKAQDIANALRVAEEFGVKIVLEGASEAHLLLEKIKAAGVPVILHPPMARTTGDFENGSFETASKLKKAGISFALEGGFESYVPKSRVVLFEAGIAAANGLSFDEALAAVTSESARILGVDARLGSIVVGKDGDLALYDGDPFEYTTHCVGTIIEGEVVSGEPR